MIQRQPATPNPTGDRAAAAAKAAVANVGAAPAVSPTNAKDYASVVKDVRKAASKRDALARWWNPNSDYIREKIKDKLGVRLLDQKKRVVDGVGKARDMRGWRAQADAHLESVYIVSREILSSNLLKEWEKSREGFYIFEHVSNLRAPIIKDKIKSITENAHVLLRLAGDLTNAKFQLELEIDGLEQSMMAEMKLIDAEIETIYREWQKPISGGKYVELMGRMDKLISDADLLLDMEIDARGEIWDATCKLGDGP